MLAILVAFLAGALAVFIIEGVALIIFLRRLVRRGQARIPNESPPASEANHLLTSMLNKQGMVWVAVVSSLDPYREAKGYHSKHIKGPKEVRSKTYGSKEIPDVSPVQKHARIQDRVLILTDIDGSEELIELEGCDITAVSGGDQPSRKWAKRYPIKLENKNRMLVFESKIYLIYLETSWEKESWCKALRLASRSDQGGADWCCKLKQEFDDYLLHLNEEYPSLLKLTSVSSNQRLNEARSHKGDIASSKMRIFLKKITKKASKTGNELKRNSISISNQEDVVSFQKKSSVKSTGNAEIDISSKVSSSEKDSGSQLIPESSSSSSSSPSAGFGIRRQSTAISDRDTENAALIDTDGDHEKSIVDAGTLCWNVILSRLFFDVKRNFEVTSSIQSRIQRLVSRARTPSYIGGITCTQLDLGKSPPHILSMRVLPVNVDEAWVLEADVEYSGGALIDIETRLEVCEPGFHDRMDSTTLESNIEEDATADLLRKGLESLGEDLEIAREPADKRETARDSTDKGETARDSTDKRDEGSTSDGSKSSKNLGWRTSSKPSWRAMLALVAGQVSQVPLALSIRLVSLKGTVRISVKPPPSDRIWFGFTSTPNLEWGLEPSIGDHKIASGPFATIIASRIKALIHETLVFPNCEDVFIPWMLAEKNDWVKQNNVPFPWLRQEISESSRGDSSLKRRESMKTKVDGSALMQDLKLVPGKHSEPKDDTSHLKHGATVASEPESHASVDIDQNQTQPIYSGPVPSLPGDTSDDLIKPLLENFDLSSTPDDASEQQNNPLYLPGTTNQLSFTSTDEKPKKGSKRTKMINLGKKMGEKFEEKRRHIEEKRRHMVVKMREGLEKFEGTGPEY